MKRLLFLAVCLFVFSSLGLAHESDAKTTVKIYCEVTCSTYNVLKRDVNVQVDFGVGKDAEEATGWIYNPSTNKKYSFASPMSVLSFMAKHGWEYKDSLLMRSRAGKTTDYDVWHFILTKEVPADYTYKDVVGDIDFRK